MEKRLGIYIHIPFCASKCGYCDFYSLADCESKKMEQYQQALETHIRQSAAQLAPYYIDSVYFGGGTPSYFGAKRLCSILNTLKRSCRVLKSAEITVEANPDSVRLSEMTALRKEGVNRISLGAQSANPDILKMIGRRHSWQQVEKAAKTIRAAGIERLSVDLIYGLPSQTKQDWADTLSKALQLQPEHLSCYGLKLEEGTPLYRYKDSPMLPSEDEQADMYLYATEFLAQCGYQQYEISNFSLPGQESRHNMKYWRLRDYMGFGPGAHSCVGHLRYSYVRDLDAYIRGIDSGGEILDEYEQVDQLDRAAEYLMLGLRTTRGICAAEYQRIYRGGFSVLEGPLREFEAHGWAKQEDGRWRFTPTGFLLSNILIGTILEAQAANRRSGNAGTVADGHSAETEKKTGIFVSLPEFGDQGEKRWMKDGRA